MRRERLSRFLALGLAVALPVMLPAQEAKPAEAQKAEAPKAEAAKEEAAPTATAERTVYGSIDVGARWVSTPGGDFNTYRSIVNLGEGVRMNNLDFNFEQPGFKLFDTMRLQANDWGGDPYNTARFDLSKEGKYRFLGTYSNIAYFNYLPSFANVERTSLGKPAFFTQRAFDTAVRNFDNELQLFPGTRITPYVAYSRNTSYGYGITTLVSNFTEFPLRNLIHWGMDTYRGGIRADFGRSHLTVEHGANQFKDDQAVYSTEAMTGNRDTPFLGQTLRIQNATQAYGVRGSGRFTKVLFVANPYDWVDLYGQVLYANPKNEPVFFQNTLGNLADTTQGLLFFNRGFDSLYGSVDRPHTSGTFAFEMRPTSRIRIRQRFETDRFKSDSTALLTTDLLTLPSTATNYETSMIDRFESTTNRETIEGLVDVSRKLTVRGGYRYEWGHSLVRAGNLNINYTREPLDLQRHIGLAGARYRPVDRLTVTADFEASNGIKTYYRTSLQDYIRLRTQARYRLVESLNLGVNYNYMDNENPAEGVNYKYRAQNTSANLQWMPKSAKFASVLAEYTRSTIESDIDYLLPPNYTTARSLYRDNAHTGTLMVDLKLPSSPAGQPVFTVGGSFVRTSGSRPSQYYQPIGRIVIPIHKKFHAYSEWRWYGLTQPFYLYEGFRTHMIMTGVRWFM